MIFNVKNGLQTIWDPTMFGINECTITLYYELAWKWFSEPKNTAKFVVMIKKKNTHTHTYIHMYVVFCLNKLLYPSNLILLGGGTDKSLARPGRKKATATKLGIYSTYSLWSSTHFLTRCYNFSKTLKKKSESCLSNQVSAAAMTSASEEKCRSFNYFFCSGNRWQSDRFISGE